MDRNYLCLQELKAQKLFENYDHMSRFNELVSCYCDYPFFTAGLCKCMYLSSWDMDHFMVMLDILNTMTIGKDQNTNEMEDNGHFMEYTAQGHDKQVMQMSAAFLEGKEYELPDEPIDEEGRHIIKQALIASGIIDMYYNDKKNND